MVCLLGLDKQTTPSIAQLGYNLVPTIFLVSVSGSGLCGSSGASVLLVYLHPYLFPFSNFSE